MTDLQIFQNPDFGEIRSVLIDDAPWFVGKDIALALGYTNPRKALDDHIDVEDKMRGDGVTIRDSIGREQCPTIINESGLYSLILSSKLPSAKKFKHWITAEVLPAIRKTGKYEAAVIETTATRTLTTDDYISAARTVATCKADRMPLILSMLSNAGFDTDKLMIDSFRMAAKRTAKKGEIDTSDAGQRIAEAVNKHHLTRQQFGDLIGVSHSAVSKYIYGHQTPSPARYKRIIQIIDALDNGEAVEEG